jgi:hypothetical protein
MVRGHAAIYLNKSAERAFYKLPEAAQKRLQEFLEAQRAELEAFGGGNKEGLAFEWQPGWAVFWDIELQPQLGEPQLKRDRSPVKLGEAYRIEVREIREFS